MLNFTKKAPFTFSIFIIVMLSFLTSGCQIKSGPRDFIKPAVLETIPAHDVEERLSQAFETTAETGKKFYFSGWSGTKIQKRMNGFYLTGSIDKDKGSVMDARIFGQPFRYYRWGNDIYLSEQDKWRKFGSTDTPLEPFIDFSKLHFLANKAVRLPDDEVLSKKCEVYQITLDSKEAAQVAEAMGVRTQLDQNNRSQVYFDLLKMKFSIWVGIEDNYIYQFKTETTMPVPNAGSFYQEVYFKFWDYNSTTVNIPGPEKIERYLIEE